MPKKGFLRFSYFFVSFLDFLLKSTLQLKKLEFCFSDIMVMVVSLGVDMQEIPSCKVRDFKISFKVACPLNICLMKTNAH